MSRVAIYGGGVAALAAALELRERGVSVELVGPAEPAHHPALPEAGISCGSDPERLLEETLRCGGHLAARPPVAAMANAAASIVAELEQWGVPFERQARRRLPGAGEADAAFVEARTSAMVTRALEGRLRALGPLACFEPYELVALTLDDGGRCVGFVARDRVRGAMRLFAADAVVLAGGGPEKLFSGLGALATEGPLSVALAAGAVVADVDRVQLHPAALIGPQRSWILSGALRSESARFWVPRDRSEARTAREVPKAERDFFLDEAHPGWGALAPDDLCARAVWRAARARGLYDRKKRRSEARVYLDASHLPEAHLRARLESELERIRVLTGVDAARVPLAVAPAAQGCLGGLWVDAEVDARGALVEGSPRHHATSIEGLYAVGDGACLYHGLCRLEGNGLLASFFGGRLGARAVVRFLEEAPRAGKPPEAFVRDAERAYQARAADHGSIAELYERLRLLALAELGLEEASDDSIDRVAEEAAELHAPEAALRELDQMVVFARLLSASRGARTAERPNVRARMKRGAIEIVDGFEYRIVGASVSIAGRHEGAPPAERRYAEPEP